MLTPLDIENKKFSKQMMNGYNVEEIDDFLDKITEDYAKLYKEVSELKSQITDMEDNVNHYKTIESTLQNTLVMAQSTADDIKRVATQQADQIVKDAELKVKETMATLKAEQISEAKKFEEMRKKFEVYKAKMEALLISQLELLKECGSDSKNTEIDTSSFGVEEEKKEEKTTITSEIPTYESISKTSFDTTAYSSSDGIPSSISDIKTSFDTFSTSSSSTSSTSGTSTIRESRYDSDTFNSVFNSETANGGKGSDSSSSRDNNEIYNPNNGISSLFGSSSNSSSSNSSMGNSGSESYAAKGIGVSDLFEDAGTINVTFPKNGKRGR